MKIYKIAISQFPYKIFISKGGETSQPESIKNVHIYAVSEEQARFKFLKKYTWLMDYLDMGYEINAILDSGKLAQLEKQEKSEEVSKKNKIENAWWNKD